MPTDAQKQQPEEVASERRKEEAGKKNIGFGGSILDMGSEDAEGVGAGK